MIIKLSEKTSEIAELADAIDECATKIAFLEEFFIQQKTSCNLGISEKAGIGLFNILAQIECELNMVNSHMGEMENKGPKLEKKKNAALAKGDKSVKE